jgi:DNA-binding NtrC family response regulator
MSRRPPRSPADGPGGPPVPSRAPAASRLKALLVEDDRDFRESLAALVEREGFEVVQSATFKDALTRLIAGSPDVALIDLTLPDGDGLELMRDERVPATCDFVIITGNASVESAVEALRKGATDYLTKPIDRARLNTILANAARTRRLKQQVENLRHELREMGRFGPLVGRSETMQAVYDLLSRVAPTRVSVLLTGESGTGKELAAETIHRLSRRSEGPFLAVNCGAITQTLIDSELFGHEKGSFTGADKSRQGYFEHAQGGTLFLDEITEMPLESQVKLLRVLETSKLMRVGASEALDVDVRVIAATNRDPLAAIQEGKLREDLFYRLNVFPIALPPLRERGKDVQLLADHFLDQHNTREKTQKRLSPEAHKRLRDHGWPGNVRELKNAVERAAIMADEMIGPEALPEPGAPTPPALAGDAGAVIHVRVGSSLDDLERRVILATLHELGGDKKRAAEVLGISLKTLYNRLNLYEAAGQMDSKVQTPG